MLVGAEQPNFLLQLTSTIAGPTARLRMLAAEQSVRHTTEAPHRQRVAHPRSLPPVSDPQQAHLPVHSFSQPWSSLCHTSPS